MWDRFTDYFSFDKAFELSFVMLILVTSFDIVFLFFRFRKPSKSIPVFLCHILATYIALNLFNAVFKMFGGEKGMIFFSIFLTIAIYTVFFGNYGIRTRIVYSCVLYSTLLSLIVFAGTFRTLIGTASYKNIVEIVLRNLLVVSTVFVPVFLRKFCFDKLIIFGHSSFIIILYNVFTLSTAFIAHIFQQRFSFEGIVLSAVVCAGFACVNLLAYYIIFNMEKSNALNFELMANKLAQERNNDAAILVENNLENMRKIRHDIKNQFAYMKLMLEEKQYDRLDDYFGEMVESSVSPLSYIDCINRNIGMILNLELAKTDMKGYVLDARLLVSPTLPFRDSDMCNLLTNLIDNAIEACDRYSIEGATIEVSIVQKDVYLYISVVNPIGETDKDGRKVNEEELLLLESSKRDGFIHGYGSKIIDGIVHKYNGEINRKINGHKFVTDIMLDMLWQADGESSAR